MHSSLKGSKKPGEGCLSRTVRSVNQVVAGKVWKILVSCEIAEYSKTLDTFNPCQQPCSPIPTNFYRTR